MNTKTVSYYIDFDFEQPPYEMALQVFVFVVPARGGVGDNKSDTVFRSRPGQRAEGSWALLRCTIARIMRAGFVLRCCTDGCSDCCMLRVCCCVRIMTPSFAVVRCYSVSSLLFKLEQYYYCCTVVLGGILCGDYHILGNMLLEYELSPFHTSRGGFPL